MNTFRWWICALALALVPVLLTSCRPLRVDDWVYQPREHEEGPGGKGYAMAPSAPMSMSTMSPPPTIGLAAGGAKDVGNFRANIDKGYLPQPSDLTYEGLFYDYSFDTGATAACQKLFCPSYSQAISRDPFSGKTEHYLSVGLNSGIREQDFARKKLNLVLVLDISGSMDSPFDEYYYDRFGNRQSSGSGGSGESKMEVASKALVAMLGHLKDDDRLGIVLFDDEAYLAKPVSPLGNVDRQKLAEHILALESQGGTDMSAGMQRGTELIEQYAGADPTQYETRIVFLTDAMPNLGDTSDTSLLGRTRANAARSIYTTFIGIGVDFNTELVERITKIRGANYYSVHSAAQFEKRLAEEFDFMVTPLVFDLSLQLKAPGYEILEVYGSPEANEATGQLMKVNTLFPSKVEAGETRGGVILLKLRKISPAATLTLETSYVNRAGQRDGDRAVVTFQAQQPDHYGNTGVRKAVLLARYADLLLNWMLDVRRAQTSGQPPVIAVTNQTGIPVPQPSLGQWERQSVPLQVPDEYRAAFTQFRAHLQQEMAALGDQRLSKEVKLLDQLIKP